MPPKPKRERSGSADLFPPKKKKGRAARAPKFPTPPPKSRKFVIDGTVIEWRLGDIMFECRVEEDDEGNDLDVLVAPAHGSLRPYAHSDPLNVANHKAAGPQMAEELRRHYPTGAILPESIHGE
jgi:hypothetical protein